MCDLFYAVTENGTIYAMNIDVGTGRLILERGSPRYGYKVHVDMVHAQDLLNNMRSAWITAKEVCHNVNSYNTAAVYLD